MPRYTRAEAHSLAELEGDGDPVVCLLWLLAWASGLLP